MTTSRRRSAPREAQEPLFPLPPAELPDSSSVRPLPLHPLWTDNKAKLIERYLHYFVLVTKHGTYIDGFAGPQDCADNWAARLVLRNEPHWLRHFHLCEVEGPKVDRLRELQRQHPNRGVEVYDGDFNLKVAQILRPEVIGQKEAVFCLLDQRTFECDWVTVERIARYKTGGYKIEIFYFLANHWFHRALAATTKGDRPERWWGRNDLHHFAAFKGFDRAQMVCRRFQKELGYVSVRPWAIYERENGRRVMYYMIHATDHPNAPYLMSRAYERAVEPKEPLDQVQLALLSSAPARRRSDAAPASDPTPGRRARGRRPSGSGHPTA